MARTPTKAEIKRMREADAIAKRRKAIKAKIREWSEKLTALEDSCPHYHSWYENKGSTGSWDRDDHYWRDYECEDCGKRWTTDQGIEQERKYPHAVKGRKNGDRWEVYRY